MVCVHRGHRQVVYNYDDLLGFFTDNMTYSKEAKDLEDKIFLYDGSRKVFLALIPATLIFPLVALILVVILTMPPSEHGPADVCSKVNSCNGNGVCDTTGECWCTLGVFDDDTGCASASVPGIIAFVFIGVFFLVTVHHTRKWLYFRREVRKLEQIRKERIEDMERMIREHRTA